MIEESPQIFPHAGDDDDELFSSYVSLELEKANITIALINKDVHNNIFNVTTCMEVPEEIKSDIRRYGAQSGFDVKFWVEEEN
jgi:hypothetical protein